MKLVKKPELVPMVTVDSEEEVQEIKTSLSRRMEMYDLLFKFVIGGDYNSVEQLLKQEMWIDINFVKRRDSLSASSYASSSSLGSGSVVTTNTSTSMSTGQETETVLLLAVENKHTSIVKLLLDKKADPNKAITKFCQNVKYDFTYTPLFLAIHRKNERIATLLVESGADVNADPPFFPERDGRKHFYDYDYQRLSGFVWNMSLLYLSIENNFSTKFIQLLIEKGSNLSTITYFFDQHKEFIQSVKKSSLVALLAFLIFLIPNETRFGSPFLGVSFGIAILTILMLMGTNVVPNIQKTPFDLAKSLKKNEIIEMLESKQLNPLQVNLFPRKHLINQKKEESSIRCLIL